MIYCQFCHSSMKQINESTGAGTYSKTYACTNPECKWLYSESLNANANVAKQTWMRLGTISTDEVAGGWTQYMGDYS